MTDELHEVLSMLPSRVKKGYVFIDSRTGEKIPSQRLTYLWETRVRRKAGFESECHLHDLRHTFASHHAISGTNLNVVQELMGHASITQTMVYAHLAPDQTTVAMKNFENALKKDTKKDTVQIG